MRPLPFAASLWLLAGCAASPARPNRPAAPAEEDPEKSYLVPAVEIIGFEFLLNQFNRHVLEDDVYDTDASTIEDNLNEGWVTDRDPFAVNQLGHPYAGSMYHGFARSAGHGYWTSVVYDLAGSALWEIAGESSSPSLNDQISTGIGGSFLGEALYRAAGWFRDERRGKPGCARSLGAAALSPSAAFHGWAFGNPFRNGSRSDPPVLARGGVGARTITHVSDQDRSSAKEETSFLAEFEIDYGQPGRSGYAYDRPFDYFHLEVTGLTDSHNHVDRAIVRGLLAGKPYGSGADLRGVWGLYGSYDYVSPGVFRVASTALSVGTTAQQRIMESVALQGSLLGGLGFGAGGTVSDDQESRDYHYGEIPQALLDLRFVFDETAMLQLTGRDYYLEGGGYNENEGSEHIAQMELSLTVRVHGPHALGLRYVASERDARYANDPDQEQSVESLSLVYSFFGGTRFGPVE